MFGQMIVSGITTGSLYALVALGFVVVYKATNVVNFALGEMVMAGAYIGLFCHSHLGLSYLGTFVATLAACAVLGLVTDRLAFRPLMSASPFTVIIASIAVLFILKNAAILLWGGAAFPFPSPFSSAPFLVAGFRISPQSVFVLAVALGIMAAFYLFFRYTKTGKAMRATQQDPEAAALMGVGVRRMLSLTWALSTALAGATGLLLAPLVGISPDMGLIAVKAFAAAIVGGFTSLTGAVAGGFLLGILENLAGAYGTSAMKDIVAFLVLILVLVVKPTGLFEKGAATRV